MPRRKGRPLGARRNWFSGYSETRFFPGFGGRGRDARLSSRGRLIYALLLVFVIGGGVALIAYEIARA